MRTATSSDFGFQNTNESIESPDGQLRLALTRLTCVAPVVVFGVIANDLLDSAARRALIPCPILMLPNNFWNSDSCHVAVNPHRAGESNGLASWAVERGMSGYCFFQTSGSEGTPKWVALSKQAFLTSAQAVNAHFEVSSADRWLIALPLHHVGGFAILARSYLSGSKVLQDLSRWHPHTFVELCEREKITLVSLVPTQIHDLVREKISCPKTLRAAIIGGGGMSRELTLQAKALGWPVFQSYGMTEAASQIATQPYRPSSADLAESALEILPHWQTRLNDDGQLVISGPVLARGYAQWNSSSEWLWQDIGHELVTRDRVKLWQQGHLQYLEFLGRESGYVKILGELVHLTPLQTHLESLCLQRGVSSIPVIMAQPDTRRECRLVLVSDSADADELWAAFNADIPPLCQLIEVIHVPRLPRSDLGKVDITALNRLISPS